MGWDAKKVLSGPLSLSFGGRFKEQGRVFSSINLRIEMKLVDDVMHFSFQLYSDNKGKCKIFWIE